MMSYCIDFARWGQVIKAKLVGVLKMQSEGTRDDKLIAVLPGTCFGDIKSMDEFSRAFPGAASIIETWFTNYEGPGKVQTEGFGSFEEASSLLNDAIKGFELTSVIAKPATGGNDANKKSHKK